MNKWLQMGTALAFLSIGSTTQDSQISKRPTLEDVIGKNAKMSAVHAVSWPETKDARTCVFLEIEEFADKSATEFSYTDTSGNVKSYHFSPEEKELSWNLNANPLYNDGTISEEAFKAYQTNSVGRTPNYLTDSPILFGKDRIVYARCNHPAAMFEYLKNWDGPPIDQLNLSMHGSPTMYAQNEPEQHYLNRDYLLTLNPQDFKGTMSENSKIFVSACSTMRGHEKSLTITETVSYLLGAPALGMLTDEDIAKQAWANPDKADGEVKTFLKNNTLYPRPNLTYSRKN